MGYKLILEDNYQDLETEIIQESTGSKKYILKGLFSTPGERNRNGRIYPKPLWESALSEWSDKAKKDPTYRLMELEHPARTSIDKWQAVAKIRKMDFSSDGKIYGEAEILDNNANPKIGQLKALIDAGIPIGVSTRGTGKLGKNNIVEAYNLITVDIVSNPSNIGSELDGSSEFTEDWILKDKEFSLNESTGKWVCDAKGCSLENIAESIDESINNKDIAAAFVNKDKMSYTKSEIKKHTKTMDAMEKMIKGTPLESTVGDKIKLQKERFDVFLRSGNLKENLDEKTDPDKLWGAITKLQKSIASTSDQSKISDIMKRMDRLFDEYSGLLEGRIFTETTETIKNTCGCKAKELTEAFNAFTAEPEIISEAEQKARELLGLDKIDEVDEYKEIDKMVQKRKNNA